MDDDRLAPLQDLDGGRQPLLDVLGGDLDEGDPGLNARLTFDPEEDIAPVVLFLASKDAQFLTGYSLTPDGGMIIDSAR